MAIRKIAQIGDPVLRNVAKDVDDVRAVQDLINDLIETMADANGAGLAATQIGVDLRVCVLEVGDNPRYPYKPKIPLTVLVNPVLTPLGDATFANYEGCLSVPNLRGLVTRYSKLRVQALDRHGDPIDLEVTGLSAGTYQHEVDHLDGKIFVDRVTDPTTFTTWDGFEQFHKQAWLESINQT